MAYLGYLTTGSAATTSLTGSVEEQAKDIVKEVEKVAPDPIPDTLLYYHHFWDKCLHTGSRVICNPPVEGTDDDWVVLSNKDNIVPFTTFLMSEGFQRGGSGAEIKDSGFLSLKKDELNVILTFSDVFFNRFDQATRLCKYLNLREKKDRVALFKAVQENQYPGDEGYEEYSGKYKKEKRKWSWSSKYLQDIVDPPVVALNQMQVNAGLNEAAGQAVLGNQDLLQQLRQELAAENPQPPEAVINIDQDFVDWRNRIHNRQGAGEVGQIQEAR